MCNEEALQASASALAGIGITGQCPGWSTYSGDHLFLHLGFSSSIIDTLSSGSLWGRADDDDDDDDDAILCVPPAE
jgi:hypothetical protein